jgi:hypothetical protein
MKSIKTIAVVLLLAAVGLVVLRLILFAIVAGVLAVIGFVALFVMGAVTEQVDKK